MTEQEIDNAGRWIHKKFCKHCEEEDDLCDCLDYHIQAMEEIGFSTYEDAEEAFEWEGYESDRKEWAQDMCGEIYCTELGVLPAFIVNTIDWDWVAQQLLMDYYQIQDKDTEDYIYLYRVC